MFQHLQTAHVHHLKIQEGCNNFCTFCIIPWARGLMRSRDPQEVIRQAQQLVMLVILKSY